MTRARLAFGSALACALALGAASARADPARADPASDAPEALFRAGTEALDRGAFQEAIDDFEALSDRGFVHPDASFDRGLAYLMRLRAGADRPGDLGRAAAAFDEATRLRPGDEAAEKELDLVRREVTRRRARRGNEEIDARPTLDRAVVGLLSDTTWSVLALAASFGLALGLLLRRVPRGPAHVAGSVLAPAAVVALLLVVPMAVEARWLAETTRTGVVVASEAVLADVTGVPIAGPPIPEAASVETGAHDAARVHVRWGAREGWVPLATVRLMP